MISKLAVEKFLARPMRDSATAKKLSVRRLDTLIRRARLRFHTEPRRAQKVCMLLGWKYSRYQFLLGMGGGKTKLSLDLFSNRRRRGEAKRCLVLVPNTINLGAWAIEVEKHAPRCRVTMIDQDGSEARWAAVDAGTEVVVITYQGLCHLVCGLVDTNKQRKKMKPDKKLLARITAAFDFMVLDETDSIKNPQSTWFKIIRAISNKVSYVYGLTGTPFDKEPNDLWSQFFVIDAGYTLGETLGLYRSAFFKSKWGYFGGMEHVFKRSMQKQLARRLRNCSIRYSESECQDLPPAVGGLSGEIMRVPVKLPREQQPYYDRVHEEMVDAGRNLTVVQAAYTRMRMVCSGWLGAVTDDGERVDIQFKSNPKFDAVVDLLGKIPENEKVIVVCWFNTTCRLMMERLKAEKQKAVLINGTTTSRDKRAAMEAFCSPGGPRVLVASTAISKGVNLQGASRYMIFVESPDSSINRRQLEGRIRREGGKQGTRYYYDVLVSGSVEERIITSLVQGRKLHDVLIDRA